jgi:hypothetical protein
MTTTAAPSSHLAPLAGVGVIAVVISILPL